MMRNPSQAMQESLQGVAVHVNLALISGHLNRRGAVHAEPAELEIQMTCPDWKPKKRMERILFLGCSATCMTSSASLTSLSTKAANSGYTMR